jgi:hypothetical protein
LDWGDGTVAQGTADNGWICLRVAACMPNCALEWGTVEGGTFAYRTELSLGCSQVIQSDKRHERMLNNMGYDVSTSLDSAVRAFQQDAGQDVTGLRDNTIPESTSSEIENRYNCACKD